MEVAEFEMLPNWERGRFARSNNERSCFDGAQTR